MLVSLTIRSGAVDSVLVTNTSIYNNIHHHLHHFLGLLCRFCEVLRQCMNSYVRHRSFLLPQVFVTLTFFQSEINSDLTTSDFDYPVLMSTINAIDIVVIIYFTLEYGIRCVRKGSSSANVQHDSRYLNFKK